MMELIRVLQFAPMNDIMMASLIVHLMESCGDKKMIQNWELLIELEMP